MDLRLGMLRVGNEWNKNRKLTSYGSCPKNVRRVYLTGKEAGLGTYRNKYGFNAYCP